MLQIVKDHYPRARCIIDYPKTFIDRPNAYQARAKLTRTPKKSNTVKFLIDITPCGAISFFIQVLGWKSNRLTIDFSFLKQINPFCSFLYMKQINPVCSFLYMESLCSAAPGDVSLLITLVAADFRWWLLLPLVILWWSLTLLFSLLKGLDKGLWSLWHVLILFPSGLCAES